MATLNTSRVVVQSVKTHRDARGSLFEPLSDAELAGQKNVHVVLTQPNEVRGNPQVTFMSKPYNEANLREAFDRLGLVL